MSGYDVSAESSASPATVFEVLQDVQRWPQWQLVDRAECEGVARSASAGAIWVLHRKGSRTRVEVTDGVPAQRFTYRMLSEQWARDYVAVIELAPSSSGGTRIRWRATFQPRPPGSGRLWEWYLTRMVRRVVAGLSDVAEHQGTEHP